MKVIETAQEMRSFAQECRDGGKTIGLVPTMGALHDGHVSLVKASQENCDVTVVSVFVNPKQFNDSDDLDKYPRTFDADRLMLKQLNVDVMFYPSVSEVYPHGAEKPKVIDLHGLDARMEGPNRPGHFSGVVQVVLRLFELVSPQKAFFGEKDYQQLAIIKHASKQAACPVQVVGCPTIREDDGLAMSSRNVRLGQGARKIAPIIYRVLQNLKAEIADLGLNSALENAKERLTKESSLELEYLELVDAQTLESAQEDTEQIRACLAVWLGGVRLIDNLQVK